jgi:hypothetical protein
LTGAGEASLRHEEHEGGEKGEKETVSLSSVFFVFFVFQSFLSRSGQSPSARSRCRQRRVPVLQRSAARRPLVRFAILYDSFFQPWQPVIETNPIHARIADLKDRVASLRGYL